MLECNGLARWFGSYTDHPEMRRLSSFDRRAKCMNHYAMCENFEVLQERYFCETPSRMMSVFRILRKRDFVKQAFGTHKKGANTCFRALVPSLSLPGRAPKERECSQQHHFLAAVTSLQVRLRVTFSEALSYRWRRLHALQSCFLGTRGLPATHTQGRRCICVARKHDGIL